MRRSADILLEEQHLELGNQTHDEDAWQRNSTQCMMVSVRFVSGAAMGPWFTDRQAGLQSAPFLRVRTRIAMQRARMQ